MIIAPTEVDALPPAPDPDDDEGDFDSAAYAWSVALDPFTEQMNNLAENVFDNAQEAEDRATDAAAQVALAAAQAGIATTQAGIATTQAGIATTQAGTATTQAGIATTKASDANNSAIAAAASAASAAAVAGAFVGTSSSNVTIGTGTKNFTTQTGEQYTAGIFMTAVSQANGANFMFGQVVSYNTGTGALVLTVSATGGSGTFADWNLSLTGPQGAQGPQGIPGTGVTPQAVGWTATAGTTPKTLTVDLDVSITGLIASIAAAANITRVPRTSNTILAAGDNGKFIDVTSGTFTQTFTAAATLGAGWSVFYNNGGTGVVTLDPNGAELIDGVASGTVKGCYLITCDGTGFSTQRVGPMADLVVLTSGTSWTVPMGCKLGDIFADGGGSSGANSAATNGIAGGAGGEFTALRPFVPGTNITYACGAGGASVTGTNINGNAGGNTTMTVGGVTMTAGGAPAANGTSGNAAGASPGGTSTNGDTNTTGAPGFATGTTVLSVGGSSRRGSGGQRSAQAVVAATGYAAGGYGALNANATDPGRPGHIEIRF